MPIDPQGKTVLITGANRGIGLTLAEAFLDAGAAKVYAAVRKPESAQPLIDKFGEKVVALELDLTKPDTIAAAAQAAPDVEILVNNAGVLKASSPLADDALDNLDFEFDVNVKGLIRVAQAFAPVLKANAGGAFVQLNSIASVRCFASFATYAASKSASYSITQGLRDALADQGTQVLSVHPGPIDTEMAKAAGLEDTDPPSIVADAVLAGLKAGDFHTFPDKMAKQIWEAYHGFAKAVIEPAMQDA
jgi:NAD(P)-dependent dehydrogenase (short-subunit alcohol dehydrogenase family)